MAKRRRQAHDIEQLLRRADADPGLRPAFFRALLDANVYALIPTRSHGLDEGKIRFVMWTRHDGLQVVPVFLSLETLVTSAGPDLMGAKLRGRQLLELVHGGYVHVNPVEPSGCFLSPADIASLLDHGSVGDPQEMVVTEEAPVSLGMPSEVPEQTLGALRSLYDSLGTVEWAYLVGTTSTGSDGVTQTGLLILFRVSGEFKSVLRDTTCVIEETYHGRMSIDLKPIGDDEDVSWTQSIRECLDPFYAKRKSRQPKFVDDG